MKTILLLIFLNVSTGTYETQVSWHDDRNDCTAAIAQVWFFSKFFSKDNEIVHASCIGTDEFSIDLI